MKILNINCKNYRIQDFKNVKTVLDYLFKRWKSNSSTAYHGY